MRMIRKIRQSEHGASAIEYALVASLISIAAVAAMSNLGGKIDSMYNNVSNHMN